MAKENMKKYVEDVLELIKKKDWNQPEFMNTAKEVLYSIIPVSSSRSVS